MATLRAKIAALDGRIERLIEQRGHATQQYIDLQRRCAELGGELTATKMLLEETQKGHSATIADF